MSEFGIKDIERMAESMIHDYKFYKNLRFIISGVVVFSFVMIYLMYMSVNPSTVFWMGIAGWIAFSITTIIDLIVTNTQVKTFESRIGLLSRAHFIRVVDKEEDDDEEN